MMGPRSPVSPDNGSAARAGARNRTGHRLGDQWWPAVDRVVAPAGRTWGST